jgi:hypothetical protein
MTRVIRILAVTMLLAAWSSIPLRADGGSPVPLCYPHPCPIR